MDWARGVAPRLLKWPDSRLSTNSASLVFQTSQALLYSIAAFVDDIRYLKKAGSISCTFNFSAGFISIKFATATRRGRKSDG